jgi:hypothetical protein
MTDYQDLQQDLDQALHEMRAKEAKATNLIQRIAEILQKHAGFPAAAFWYRTSVDEPREEAFPLPENKIERSTEGTWKVVMDIRIDAATSETPVHLPAPVGGSHSVTFIPLEVKFIENGRTEIAIEGDSASALQLSGIPETDQRQLSDFCMRIRKKIEETIHWVATGQGNPRRRMGFHAE